MSLSVSPEAPPGTDSTRADSLCRGSQSAQIDFRHHQRHGIIHAEGAGIVDEHRAGGFDGRCKLLGQGIAGRAKHNIHTLEGLFCGFFHNDSALAEGQFQTRAARAGQGFDGFDGEFSFLEYLQHFATDCTGSAEYGNIDLFHSDNPLSDFDVLVDLILPDQEEKFTGLGVSHEYPR